MISRQILQAGFSRIELPFIQMSVSEQHQLYKVLNTQRISIYSVHADKHLFNLPDTIFVPQLLATAQFAKNVGARIIVVHPGRGDVPLTNSTVTQIRSAFSGLVIAFENTTSAVLQWVHVFREITDCGLTLDSSHAQHLSIPLEKYFEFPVVHTHIRGYSPEEHYHRIEPQDHQIKLLLEKCKAYGYNGVYTLEYPYTSSVEAAQDRVVLENLLEEMNMP